MAGARRDWPRNRRRAWLSLLAACGCTAALEAQPRPVGRQAASVAGTVIDSVTTRVLAGATVQLMHPGSDESAARTVTSDSLGRFRFSDVRPGQYRLGFQHPALDALGVEPPPVDLVVRAGMVLRTDLALPSAATLRLALCGDGAVRDSIALILGFARRARDRAALDSVIVTVEWQPRRRGAGSAPGQSQRRRVAASPRGWFVVCGAQSGDSIQLGASRNGAGTTNLALAIPVSGLLHHDVLLSDAPAPAIAGTPITRDSTAREAQGSSKFPVNGVVVAADDGRPITGAIVSISGGAVTRSDAQGAWTLSGVSGGTQTLAVRAVRYAPLSVTLSVARQMPPVRLTLARLQALLDTVNVQAEAETDRNLAGFLERSRTRGSGTFLSTEDVISRRPTLTSDLFQSVQGGLTIERDSLGNRFLTMRSNTLRSDRCLPAIFVDGMSMRRLTIGEIDGLIRPDELFGVEVYRAANAPVEFSEQDGCGTILFWTKR